MMCTYNNITSDDVYQYNMRCNWGVDMLFFSTVSALFTKNYKKLFCARFKQIFFCYIHVILHTNVKLMLITHSDQMCEPTHMYAYTHHQHSIIYLCIHNNLLFASNNWPYKDITWPYKSMLDKYYDAVLIFREEEEKKISSSNR